MFEKQDVRNLFLEYWERINHSGTLVDLGMGMPSPELLSPLLGCEQYSINAFANINTYQPQSGSAEVRQAIAAFESKRTGKRVALENVALIGGAIRGFSLLLDTVLKPGGKMIEFVPSYPLLAGYSRVVAERKNCEIIKIEPHDTLFRQYSLDNIQSQVTDSTVVYLTDPNNPTGNYLEGSFLSELQRICRKAGAYIIVDQACDLPLSSQHTNIRWEDGPFLVRLQSFSKVFSLAGVRLGYIVADEPIITRLSDLLSFSEGNAPTVANNLIPYYMTHAQEIMMDARNASIKCIDMVSSMLADCSKVETIIPPQACYYIFSRIAFKGGSWDLFEVLAKNQINVVPGTLFGVNEGAAWIRICCARPERELVRAVSKLTDVLENI